MSTPATISVLVRPDNDQSAPPETVDDSTSVNEGQSINHNVILNDTDPDGDALALFDVGDPDRGGRVRFRPDGQVVYSAPAPGSGVTGEVRIPYVVADATGQTDEGVLVVDVKPADFQSSPIARDDFDLLRVGDTITINVLANDSDANGDSLSLVSLTPDGAAGGSATFDVSGQVTYTAVEVGSFQYDYLVSDSTPQPPGPGKVRFEVIEPTGTSPPVAVRDDVALTPGRPTIVDVLANDVDRDGDVLVIQAVSEVPNGLVVEVVDGGFLRLTAPSAAGQGDLYMFRYTISDGPSTDTGLVVVRTVPVRGESQPPVLQGDLAQVHAGGVVVIPVLSNDYDPDGDTLVVESAVVREPIGTGVFSVQGDVVRYFAPADFDGTVTGTYSVFDGLNRVSETIRIRVRPLEENDPPSPPDIEARTFSGVAVTIPLPLTAMDPDGDPVELLGLVTDPNLQPRLGQVVEVLADRIVYEPFAVSAAVGTDVFAYRVRDPFGGEGVGLIKVGVVPRSPTNQPPVAVDDELTVKPGRQLRFSPLANDSDPDGDPIFLDEPSLVAPDAGEVSVDGNELVFVAPAEPAVVTMSYRIVDARQGESEFADIEIRVSEDSANRSPVAVDDAVEAKRVGERVTVDVLANDVDPDGDVRLLTVSLPVPVGDAAVATDGSITFTMPDRAFSFAYTVADPLDPSLTSTAFVQVPLAMNRPPVVKRPPVVVTGYNENVEFDPLVGVSDPDGDEVRVVAESFAVARGAGVVVPGAQRAEFDPDDLFSGPVGISYRVTDGELETVAFVLIEVESSGNVTPQFPLLAVTVPAGSETRLGLDTPAIVIDPDNSSHTFSGLDTSGLPASIEAELSSAGQLVIRSTDPRGKGQNGQISFLVDDGVENGTVTGTVSIEVTGSDKAPPSARPDELEVKQTESPVIGVLDNDVDPFQAETGDRQLTIVRLGALTPSAAGIIELSADAQTVSFRPDPEYDGTATFAYTIQDRTADAERESTALVTLTIKGEPSAPGVPQAVAENRQVSLTWAPSDPNGDPITGYEVVDGTGSVRCAVGSTLSNSCTATGLTNGTTYQFRVRAQNSVGFGPWSEDLSLAVVPDAKPGTPAPPRLRFGDGEITVEWDPPVNDGSPLQFYYVRMIPGGTTREVRAETTQLVWTGLTNGTTYSFQVQAKNVTFDSEYSELASERPAGRPLNQPAPNEPSVGDQTVTVSWGEPNSNGDPADSYELGIYRDGALVRTVEINESSSRSYSLSGATNGAKYKFNVRSENKAGWSDWSGFSVEKVPSGKPLQIASLSASPTGVSGRVQLTFPDADGNGAAISGYQYSLNGGSWQAVPANRLITGLANGTDYSFRVIGCNVNGCSTDRPSPSASANPYGSPAVSVTSANVDGTTISWSWALTDSGGRPLNRFDVYLNGGLVYQGSGTSYTSSGLAYSTGYTLRVVAVNSEGLTGEAQRSATSGSAPVGTVAIGLGSRSSGDCRHGNDGFADFRGCYNIRITMNGWPSTHTVRCWASLSSSTWWNFATFNAGNGTHQACSYSAAGRGVVVSVDTTVGGVAYTSVYNAGSGGAVSNIYSPWPTD
jgi:hypothetical protein